MELKEAPNQRATKWSKLITFLLLLLPLLGTLFSWSVSSWTRDSKMDRYRSSSTAQNAGLTKQGNAGCNLFTGNWIPSSAFRPYYTNESNCKMDVGTNCIKSGRPDTEFMKWRWKPDDCELPMFDAATFLELVRGKTMVFVGDSLARNQMQSLACILSAVDDPMEVDGWTDWRYRLQWHFVNYNFRIKCFWSPHLVRSEGADAIINPHTAMNLYIDEPDALWASGTDSFDYVIISAGHWFHRPLMYYLGGEVVGCHKCKSSDIAPMDMYYGYRMAFRIAFRTLLRSDKFKGTVFLRTLSPPHFENGEWNTGGACPRTRPVGRREFRLGTYYMGLYWTEVEEAEAAERMGRKKGLKFWIIDSTEMMGMRADGHPNHYGRGADVNGTGADCVHWCLQTH